MIYRVEYYYDRPQKLWRADLLDMDGNVVDYVNGYTKEDVLCEIECYKLHYDIKEVVKTSFYK